MSGLFIKAVERLPTLSKSKKPGVAAFVGFAFGGIGLGLYFRSFIDFLLTIVAGLLVTVATSAALGWVTGAVIAGVYGFYRAQDSNKRLAANLIALGFHGKRQDQQPRNAGEQDDGENDAGMVGDM